MRVVIPLPYPHLDSKSFPPTQNHYFWCKESNTQIILFKCIEHVNRLFATPFTNRFVQPSDSLKNWSYTWQYSINFPRFGNYSSIDILFISEVQHCWIVLLWSQHDQCYHLNILTTPYGNLYQLWSIVQYQAGIYNFGLIVNDELNIFSTQQRDQNIRLIIFRFEVFWTRIIRLLLWHWPLELS